MLREPGQDTSSQDYTSLSMEMVQENERLRAQLADMRSSPSPLEAATTKREELASDQEKFKKVIENLQVCLHAHPQGAGTVC